MSPILNWSEALASIELITGPSFSTFSTSVSTRRRGTDDPTISSNIDERSISSRSARFSLRIRSSARLRSSMSVAVAFERVASLLFEAFDIFGMKYSSAKVRTPRFVRAQTRVFETQFVDVQRLPIRGEHGDHLRDHVDDRSEFRFRLLHFGERIRKRRLRPGALDRDECDVTGLLEQFDVFPTD
jgi:hypothetical protein